MTLFHFIPLLFATLLVGVFLFFSGLVLGSTTTNLSREKGEFSLRSSNLFCLVALNSMAYIVPLLTLCLFFLPHIRPKLKLSSRLQRTSTATTRTVNGRKTHLLILLCLLPPLCILFFCWRYYFVCFSLFVFPFFM